MIPCTTTSTDISIQLKKNDKASIIMKKTKQKSKQYETMITSTKNKNSHRYIGNKVPTATLDSHSIIKQPNIYDIKCGQDKTYEDHIGNQYLRTKIIQSVPMYLNILSFRSIPAPSLSCTSKSSSSSSTSRRHGRIGGHCHGGNGKKKMKSFLIQRIVNEMKKQYNSRFVRYDTTYQCWIEISYKLAHEKVSHSLRTYIKRHCFCNNNNINTWTTHDDKHSITLNKVNTNVLSFTQDNHNKDTTVPVPTSSVIMSNDSSITIVDDNENETTNNDEIGDNSCNDTTTATTTTATNTTTVSQYNSIDNRLYEQQQKLLQQYILNNSP
jgi:hypothetical protein